MAAFIFTAVTMVFQSARHGAFLAWDDDINITANPHLRELTWDNVRWMFTDADYMRRYVPLAWLNWGLDRAWFGLTPRSAHAGNILFHAANTVLVFFLVRALLTLTTAGRAGGSGLVTGLAAAAGALLWGVHPLRVEVVAWASGRIYGQAIFFLLVATLAYLQAAKAAPRTLPRRCWFVASLAAFTGSLLTYPLALCFVAVLVVIDVFVLRRFPSGFWRDDASRAVWREKIPFLAVSVAVVAVSLVARFQAQGLWEPPPTLAELGIFPRAMRAFYVWAYYGWRPFVPTGLAPVYTTLFDFNPLDAKFVLSAAAVAACTAVLVWQRRRWPGALALWLCHLALLAPMLGLTEHPHYPNDRYSYPQGVLWAVAAAAVLLTVSRRVSVPVAVATIAVGGVLSIGQIRIWRDSETLFRHLMSHVGEHHYRCDIAFRLAEALRSKGVFDEAAERYRESLRIEPRGSRANYAYLGLGRIARANGAVQEAASHFRQSIALRPSIVEPYLELGEMLLGSGAPAEAAVLLEQAVALAPNHVLVHHYRGAALLQTGRASDAVLACAMAVRLAPRFVEARCNYAAALTAAGRPAEAVTQCREALRLNPLSPEAHANLGDALRVTGDFPAAIAAQSEAVRLKPEFANAQNGLGMTLALSGRVAEAVGPFQAAVRANPAFALAHFNLGLALRDLGRNSEAADAFSAAVRLNPNWPEAKEALARLPMPPR